MHHTASHYFCNGMRRKIFGIFTSAVGVVIFNQVFENGSVKIELFVKDMLETETNQFIDNSTAKIIPSVGNIFANVLEKGNFFTVLRDYRKYIAVFFSNVQ